jgi:hypothetical protein
MPNDSLAQEYIGNLMDLLVNEAEELSPSELMDEVFLLLNDYKEDLEIDEDTVTANEELYDEMPEATRNMFVVNRGFILDKATKLYYKNNDLDAEKFAELSPSEKTIHRTGITALFQKMLTEESEKPPKPTKLSSNLFKSKVVRKEGTEEETVSTSNEELSIEREWYKEQIDELKKKMRFCKAEIQELERQNKIDKISYAIVTRNESAIEDLNREYEIINKDLEKYKSKLTQLQPQ